MDNLGRKAFVRSSLLLTICVTAALASPPAHVLAPDFPSPADSWIKGKHYSAKNVWLNTHPLRWESLNGRVVLLQFWDFADIHSLRALEAVKKWDQLYQPYGLSVVGVHTPEFDFAYNPKTVKKAVKRLDVRFAVIVDSDYRMWRAYGSIPERGRFLIAGDRRILYQQRDEGQYAEMERQIREALLAAHPQASLPPPAFEKDQDLFDDACGEMTEDVYVGRARAEVSPWSAQSASPEGIAYVRGAWKSEEDARRADVSNEKVFIGVLYRGAEAFAVLNTAGRGTLRLYVQQDARSLTQADANADIRFDTQGKSYIDVKEAGLYYLTRNPDDRLHDLRLIPSEEGLGVYAFTFSNRCLTRPVRQQSR